MKAGVEQIYYLSVNDSFVMNAWAESLGVIEEDMIPDGNGDFTIGMAMGVNKRHVGFGMRTWRYVMYVDDMEIVFFSQEDGMNNDGSDEDPYVNTKPQVVLDWFDTEKEF